MKQETGVLGLTAIRRNRGVSLEQIAESTKISIRSLEAIENGEFRKLPGGIYNTSYIRQYAQAIHYPEADLLAYYHCEMAGADSGPRPQPTRGGMYRGMRAVTGLFGS